MRPNSLISAAALAAAALAGDAAIGQGATVTSPVEWARHAEMLQPGQWVWAPQIAPAGPITVFVDLSRQLATIYRNGVRIGVSTVSTGKPGHETPVGVFTILQKDPKHHSSRYNNAPMPYQQRLTWDGVALHAGGLPGYPESHGCVHLPLAFSQLLFGETHLGGTVIVAGRAGSPTLVPAAGVLAPAGEAGALVEHVPLAEGEPYRWQPELAPDGPLTMIVSRSDKRIVVSRNGVEIGRSWIELPTGDFETHVYTYMITANGQSRWIVVGVPGHEGEAGHPLDTAILAQVRMPRGFLSALRAALVPGATVLVTQAPVLPSNSGLNMTIMASE
jgi:hypothetical protein